MAEELEPLSEDEFKGIVKSALRDAIDFADKEIAPDRAEAMKRYRGESYGDERDGRSKVIATEVRDTIQAILPSLIRVFASTEKAVEYIPRMPEDVPFAEQATDLANVVFYSDNPGFDILETRMLDGLLSKVGIVKFWWDRSKTVTVTRHTGLSDDEMTVLLSDPSVELLAHSSGEAPGPDGQPVQSHDVEIKRTVEAGRIKIVNVPPDEFIIDRDARTIEDAKLVGHRRRVTLSDLVAMGYKWADVKDLPDEDDADEEKAARFDSSDDDEPADPSLRKVSYSELYMLVDKDGDGIAELRRVCVAGKGDKILHEEPWDHKPFAAWCPVKLPHAFFGQSIADLTMDLQRIKTVIWRQTLDNLVLANNPRVAIVEGQVNLDDALNDEMGAVIRMRAPGMYQPMAVPFVAGQSLPVLDMLDQVKESRTGMSKASMGLDADSLQSTTKAAVAATISAAQGKVELLARIFAESGMKPLFRGILKLVVRHQDKARVVRLRNQFVPMDPRSWDAEMDVSVNVGLGRGSDDQRMQALMMVKQTQEQILLQLGPQNPLCGLPQYRATLAALVEMGGYKDASKFFTDPAQQPPMPPAPPKPDPKMIEAQAKMQIEAQKAQSAAQLDQQKAQQSMTLEQAKLQAEINLKREAMAQELAMKREQFAAELELRKAQMIAEAQLSREANLMDAQNKAQMAQVHMGGEVG